MKTNTSGQSVIEYIILVAIIAVASLGVVRVLGNTISAKVAQITLTLQGKRAKADQVKIPEIKKKHWEKRGMDDFYEASE